MQQTTELLHTGQHLTTSLWARCTDPTVIRAVIGRIRIPRLPYPSHTHYQNYNACTLLSRASSMCQLHSFVHVVEALGTAAAARARDAPAGDIRFG